MEKIDRIRRLIKNRTLLRTVYEKKIKYKRCLFYLKDNDIKKRVFDRKTYNILLKKYSRTISEYKNIGEKKKNDVVWVSWLQGYDAAPELVKTCIDRIYKIFGKKSVKLITSNNINDYVNIPGYIIDKWKNGIISNAHFSDILRTCLLVEHGGLWIDSTILLLDEAIPKQYRSGELFIFSNTIDKNAIENIQSSYIYSCSNNEILSLTRELLFDYWKKENFLIHYSLFHIFFFIAESKYPECWKNVKKYPSHLTHILRKELLDKYDEERYLEIKKICPIQKLTYKKALPNDLSGTLYEKLFIKKEF